MACHVRVADADDAPAIRSIYAPFVETPVTFEVDPPSVGEVADRIETTTQRHPWLVCEADGEVIGYASASKLRSAGAYRWTVELSVYVDEAVRRSGVGTALYTSLLNVLELQGYYSAYAAMTVPNPASTALHERLGFDRVATFPDVGYKHGEWHDVRWWHRRLAERPAVPDEPTPLPGLRGSDELSAALEIGEQHIDV
jgi:phosphinothricin acetyltransferase